MNVADQRGRLAMRLLELSRDMGRMTVEARAVELMSLMVATQKDEREACACLCVAAGLDGHPLADSIAAAIRARGGP